MSKASKTRSQTCACDPYNLHGDQALSSSLVLKMSNKEDVKDFEAMTEKNPDLSPSKLVTFPSEYKSYFKEPTEIVLINVPLQLYKKTPPPPPPPRKW